MLLFSCFSNYLCDGYWWVVNSVLIVADKYYPVYTVRKLNVHKTTPLRPASTGWLSHRYWVQYDKYFWGFSYSAFYLLFYSAKYDEREKYLPYCTWLLCDNAKIYLTGYITWNSHWQLGSQMLWGYCRKVLRVIWEIFSKFLLFCNFFDESFSERSNNEIWETRKIFSSIGWKLLYR